MHIRIYLSPKRVALGIIALLTIVDGTFIYHTKSYNSQIPSLERQVRQLKKDNKHQSFKDKHPTIRKTVPSAYKKMMSDGKIVCNAENQLIRYASMHHTTKLNMNNQHVHTESNILKQYISGSKLTDGDAFNNPWTNSMEDRVVLAPGASDEDGMYECSFIVEDPRTHSIDNILNGTYDSQDRHFEDMTEHNTDSVTNGEEKNAPKKHKHRRANRRKVNNKRKSKFRQQRRNRHSKNHRR